MRFHLLMLIIVILVSLGMHGMASAGVSASSPGGDASAQDLEVVIPGLTRDPGPR